MSEPKHVCTMRRSNGSDRSTYSSGRDERIESIMAKAIQVASLKQQLEFAEDELRGMIG